MTYLSSLNPTFATNGWGPYERDRSNGEQGAADGGPITLAGVVYARGLGTHAASDLRYTVPAGTCSFLAVDRHRRRGRQQRQPHLPGAGRQHQPLPSPALTGASATVNLNLAIPAGTTQLRLVVADGATPDYDHADWADARFSCSSGGPPNTPPEPVIDTPAAGTALVVGADDQLHRARDRHPGWDAARGRPQLAAGPAALPLDLPQPRDPELARDCRLRSFGAPDHEYPSYLELQLTATDAGGLSTTVIRRLDPQTVT